MALSTKVKVSEVTNLSDARYCAGMGVEMIGFPLDENHPKFIDLSKAKEISTWICGIKMVGEFVGTNYSNINYLSEQLGIDYVQLAHPVDPAEAKSINKPLIVQILFSGNEDETRQLLDKYKDLASIFLIESDELDSIEGYESFIKDVSSRYNIILGFGIDTNKLGEITNEIKPFGIGLRGGEEIKPGLKTFDELAEILEELEID